VTEVDGVTTGVEDTDGLAGDWAVCEQAQTIRMTSNPITIKYVCFIFSNDITNGLPLTQIIVLSANLRKLVFLF
jgi:hypothetical protein